MNKNLVIALVLILLSVLILLFNHSGGTTLNLLVTEVRLNRALAFLGFQVSGVLIGLLLK